ncbi:MAG TPA: XdhC family protein [Tahibacter sp.]|uniref:XdhC family protein n=1 Tax=Tahibacter sp. TaxID=2056211 RepID=UPI002B5EE0CB|nr:XdhC family protein [Tahibacter sp.]HSX61525.1 XdhC family protein [Tahibacter sp.]
MNGDIPAAGDDGGLRAILRALRTPRAAPAVLAVVVATEGSTYRKPGALILLPQQGVRIGWLSGGCLEAELEHAAARVAADGRAHHLRLDTRSDDDLVFGSSSGCRGVVELMLLPLDESAPLLAALRSLERAQALALDLGTDGSGVADDGTQRWEWRATAPATDRRWSLRLIAPKRLLLLGAGPESRPLLRLAHLLGWSVEAVETRARWFDALAAADALHANVEALALPRTRFDAAVVMSHHYSRDRDFLNYCADSAIPWVGLLGPIARRDALLAELDAPARERLLPRLHAPVGLRLGGEGPEAIALSIAAALQRDVT